MATLPKRIETLVGFFLFVGLSILGLLILQFGRFTDRLHGVYTVKVSFSDAAGVIKGSAVRLSGAKVGQVVKEPQLTDDGKKVIIELVIRKNTPPIDRNATFQVASLSILGDKVIVITPPRPPDRLPANVDLQDGDFVEGGEATGLGALQSDAEDIASKAADLLSRGGTTLTNIDGALDEMRSVASQLSESLDRVNTGILSDENMKNFSDSLAGLKGATENIEGASMEIKPLIAEAKEAVRSFDRAAEGAEGTFAQASSEISKLGPALRKVPEAVESISGVAEDARETLQSVKKSEGLLGTLAYDREVKDDAKTFLRNLRHYGILRYRDAATFEERDPRNRFRGRRR